LPYQAMLPRNAGQRGRILLIPFPLCFVSLKAS
jgi:hypothetical protein